MQSFFRVAVSKTELLTDESSETEEPRTVAEVWGQLIGHAVFCGPRGVRRPPQTEGDGPASPGSKSTQSHFFPLYFSRVLLAHCAALLHDSARGNGSGIRSAACTCGPEHPAPGLYRGDERHAPGD
ncbi:hypothetical protein AAFF_G00036520 [Aldrovandia affinis]|uniref:Uncharacterized protein n=1 Tax=Aldrovandia affinis TaxID=143900 RepID=A0AAD7S5K7_9TELE|nr:hypothetical protein AAFF_G00036520 [Aldrovandia affinis]